MFLFCCIKSKEKGFENEVKFDLSERKPGNSNKEIRILVALFDSSRDGKSLLQFRKGDRMQFIKQTSNLDWWKVKHLGTKVVGKIPKVYVAEEGSIESKDWFFGKISRAEAESLLNVLDNPCGTFLIRLASRDGYALSVKDFDGVMDSVKHYNIKELPNGGFYLTLKQTFATLQSLVNHYSCPDSVRSADVSRIQLYKPCLKPKPQIFDLEPDKWELDRNEIKIKRLLGRGNFGEVYYGKYRNKTPVAVKQLRLREGLMTKAEFMDEAAMMKKISDIKQNHLVALYGVCTKEEPIFIVQEYMSKGNLLDFLRQGDGRLLQYEALLHIATQIASGMKYFEMNRLVHRDLAARNVLIGDNNIAKVGDFGMAREATNSSGVFIDQKTRIPVKWSALEVITDGRFSIKSDVWSYGVLLMELFTFGQEPYREFSNENKDGGINKIIIEQVRKGYRMVKPKAHQLTDNVYSLMLNCWNADPLKRPTFEYLHHFFETFPVSSELAYREVEE